MLSNHGISTLAPTLLAAVCAYAWLGLTPGRTYGQTPAGGSSDSSLFERQGAVRDRLARLESTMIKLSGLLEEREPEKAERLRDALQYTGSRRLKARFRELTEMLEAGRYSEAEARQTELLTDLDALLTLLTSSTNEVEKRREERRRLEALKREISELLDEQTRLLHAALRLSEMSPGGEQATPDESDEARRLEQSQRELQQRAERTKRGMSKSGDAEQAPGAERIEQSAEQMQKAADRLGENQAEQAAREQREAAQQLQQALDELDDVLRQVRREESEETLTALEARLRGLLERERRVYDVVQRLGEIETAAWSRGDRLELSEVSEIQETCADQCEATFRLLVDEGTTVIVPVLLRQLGEDMADAGARLQRMDLSSNTRSALSDIIAQLEELLAAVEQKRDQDARLDQQGGGGKGDDRPPLLPGSAELKLLKNSQLRLNDRTIDLMEDAEISEEELTRETERMSERQRRLAELARRMNERQ